MENENELIGGESHDESSSQALFTDSPTLGEVLPAIEEENGNQNDLPAQQGALDYGTFTKIQFATLLKDLAKDAEVRIADSTLREIKPFLDDIRERERIDALKIFIAEGGAKEDFNLKSDPYDVLIDGSIKLIRDRKVKLQREQEALRNDNLAKVRRTARSVQSRPSARPHQ